MKGRRGGGGISWRPMWCWIGLTSRRIRVRDSHCRSRLKRYRRNRGRGWWHKIVSLYNKIKKIIYSPNIPNNQPQWSPISLNKIQKKKELVFSWDNQSVRAATTPNSSRLKTRKTSPKRCRNRTRIQSSLARRHTSPSWLKGWQGSFSKTKKLCLRNWLRTFTSALTISINLLSHYLLTKTPSRRCSSKWLNIRSMRKLKANVFRHSSKVNPPPTILVLMQLTYQ